MSSTFSIRVAADLEGIRLAAKDLFLEQLLEQEAAAALTSLGKKSGGNTSEIAASYAHERKYAEGYYLWVQYLLELKRQLAVPVQSGISVSADELDGLHAINAAFEEFRQLHPPCVHCGAMNRSYVAACWNCKMNVREKH